MRLPKQTEPLATILATAIVAASFVFGNQIAAWATTKCKQPNTSTKFCTTAGEGAVPSCGTVNALICDSGYLQERNKFPRGSVDAASGTTAEASADCSRTQVCQVDPNNRQRCVASGTWNAYVPGDKVVVGTNQCPTKEG